MYVFYKCEKIEKIGGGWRYRRMFDRTMHELGRLVQNSFAEVKLRVVKSQHIAFTTSHNLNQRHRITTPLHPIPLRCIAMHGIASHHRPSRHITSHHHFTSHHFVSFSSHPLLFITSFLFHNILSNDIPSHPVISSHLPTTHLTSPFLMHTQPQYFASLRNQPHDMIQHQVTSHYQGWCAQKKPFGQRSGWWLAHILKVIWYFRP